MKSFEFWYRSDGLLREIFRALDERDEWDLMALMKHVECDDWSAQTVRNALANLENAGVVWLSAPRGTGKAAKRRVRFTLLGAAWLDEIPVPVFGSSRKAWTWFARDVVRDPGWGVKADGVDPYPDRPVDVDDEEVCRPQVMLPYMRVEIGQTVWDRYVETGALGQIGPA